MTTYSDFSRKVVKEETYASADKRSTINVPAQGPSPFCQKGFPVKC